MRVFISYSRSDAPFCHELAHEVLKPYDVWFDQDIPGGVRWWQMILNEIQECDVFIYLLSTESVSSKYCRDEYAKAVELNKEILPLLIRRNTLLPDELQPINYVDMQAGLNKTSLVKLFDSLIRMERKISTHTILQQVEQKPKIGVKRVGKDFSYNFVRNFARKSLAMKTQQAYFRHVSSFIDWLTDKNIERSLQERHKYLSSLSLTLLQDNLNERNVRLWLDSLHANGTANLGQHRAAIRLFADLLVEDQYIDEKVAYAIGKIDIRGSDNAGQEYRILKIEELENLITVAENNISRNIDVRNLMILSLSLVIRSGSIHKLQWKHLQNDRGSISLATDDIIKLPNLTVKYLQRWKKIFEENSSNLTPPEAYIVTRFRGGVIYNEGVTNSTIIDAVTQTASKAGFQNVNPESLRLSFSNILENINPNYVL